MTTPTTKETDPAELAAERARDSRCPMCLAFPCRCAAMDAESDRQRYGLNG